MMDSTPNQDKLNDLSLVEKRLENWFAPRQQSLLRLEGDAKKRWESLHVQKEADRSHVEFLKLNIAKSSDGVITGIIQSVNQSELIGELVPISKK